MQLIKHVYHQQLVGPCFPSAVPPLPVITETKWWELCHGGEMGGKEPCSDGCWERWAMKPWQGRRSNTHRAARVAVTYKPNCTRNSHLAEIPRYHNYMYGSGNSTKESSPGALWKQSECSNACWPQYWGNYWPPYILVGIHALNQFSHKLSD